MSYLSPGAAPATPPKQNELEFQVRDLDFQIMDLQSNARDLEVQIPNLDIQNADLDVASKGDHQARPSTSNVYLCKGAIDKATLLVDVARESHQNTTLRNNSNV